MRTEKEVRKKYDEYIALYKELQVHHKKTGIDLRCFTDNISGCLGMLEVVLEESEEE